jgi:hypothetical protein
MFHNLDSYRILKLSNHSLLLYRLGGSLKAKGFGDGAKSHPQASLEAATLRITGLFHGRIFGINYT